MAEPYTQAVSDEMMWEQVPFFPSRTSNRREGLTMALSRPEQVAKSTSGVTHATVCAQAVVGRKNVC